MRIVIASDGKVGVSLAEQLSREGHDIVLIDKNLQLLKEAMENYDVMGVHGNGASLSVQREAGVDHSDLMIAATSADEVNLLSCMLARRLGVGRTIARVRNPEYDEQVGFLKEDLGLSMMVNPERATAVEILNLLRFPAAMKRDTFAKGRVEIIEIKVTENSILCDRYLHELALLTRSLVLVCAVERGNDVVIPAGSFRLRAGDNIYVTGTSQQLGSLTRKLDLADHKIRNVMIIGGSRVAYYLANALLDEGMQVKIVELDPARAAWLAEMLPKARILCADGSQPALLQSEGLAESDAVVTLTDIDETNIVLSLFAKRMGIYKTITKISRVEYKDLAQKMGVESIVSPKALVCSNIVRYVRALGNTEKEPELIALHRIVNDRVEALEFAVTEDTLHRNVPLRDLKLERGVLLVSINRSGRIIIPCGSDHLQTGDSVVLVTKADRMYAELNSIFA